MPTVHYDVYLTFYGFDDNDDGEGHYGTSVIAYPHLHKVATEDRGTYYQPSTCAAEKGFLKPGTKIYVPRLMKYYIMEDGCVECSQDWSSHKKRIDLFIQGTGPKLIDRENELTLDSLEIVVFDPPPHLPVSTKPLGPSS